MENNEPINNVQTPVENTAGAQQNNSPGETQSTTDNGAKNETKAEKTYTQEEINRLFDARFKRETEKWEQKLTESQKMAKMNAEQKAKYESEKHKKELAEREKNITMRELQATAKETLIEKGLPVELYTALNYTDAETCTKSIEAVDKAFKTAVEKAVNERILKSGGIPKSGSKTEVKDPFLEGLGL